MAEWTWQHFRGHRSAGHNIPISADQAAGLILAWWISVLVGDWQLHEWKPDRVVFTRTNDPRQRIVIERVS